MTDRESTWTVRLTAHAQADYQAILSWTNRQFGALQMVSYDDTLVMALTALCVGPHVPGAKHREDIGKGMRTLHVAREGRPGRHLLVFRQAPLEANAVDVLRILHDQMDLARHLSDNNNDRH